MTQLSLYERSNSDWLFICETYSTSDIAETEDRAILCDWFEMQANICLYKMDTSLQNNSIGIVNETSSLA